SCEEAAEREPAGAPSAAGARRGALTPSAADEVGVVLARGLQNRPQALAPLAPALVRALLVPGVLLGEAEDPAVVALALEAPEGRLERLVGANLNLDGHAGI